MFNEISSVEYVASAKRVHYYKIKKMLGDNSPPQNKYHRG